MPVFKRQHFSRLLDLAQQGRIPPIYLFVGDIDLAQELAKKLISILDEQGILIEEHDLEENRKNFFLSLTNPPLLGRKLLKIKASEDQLSSFFLEIINVLSSCKKISLLLFTEKISSSHALYRFAYKKGVLVPLKRLKRVKDFLQYELPAILSELGKKMERDTAEFLLSITGENIVILRQELEKLSLYVGERDLITKEDVLMMVSPLEERAPYTLMEVLLEKGPEEAFFLFKNLSEQGLHYLVFISTFLTFFKRLWLLQYVFSKKENLRKTYNYLDFKRKWEQASKELWPDKLPKVLDKLHPYIVFLMRKYLTYLNKDQLLSALKYLFYLDLSLKRGYCLPEHLFYLFFLKLNLSSVDLKSI